MTEQNDRPEWRTGKKAKPVYEYTEESWRDGALCAQIDVGDIFFPEHSGEHGREAKKICAGCEVRDPCLEYALHRPEWGIWGGKSANQRKAMRRDLGIKLIQEPFSVYLYRPDTPAAVNETNDE